ncbi:MAG: OmpA family protein [Bacteroidota bacterium]
MRLLSLPALAVAATLVVGTGTYVALDSRLGGSGETGESPASADVAMEPGTDVPGIQTTIDTLLADDGLVTPLGAPEASGARARPPAAHTEVAGERLVRVEVNGGMRFERGSAEVPGHAAPVLEALADGLQDTPGALVHVHGHAADEGSAAAEARLSTARAAAAARVFRDRGFPASRLTVQGYGSTRPVESAPRADSRRVEIWVVDPEK